MIARVWRGWTKAEDADAYEHLLRATVYPGSIAFWAIAVATFCATIVRMKRSLSP